MKVDKEQTGASRWVLTIEVPADDTQAEVEAELKKLQKEIQMPGFRRGRVPLSMIRKRFEKTLQLDVLRDKLGEYYGQALKEADIGEPVAMPDVEIVQLEADKPLIFTATVDVEPPIELASYDGLTVVRERVEVGDEEVDKQIDRLRERHAIIEDDPEPAGAESLLEVDLQELDAGFVPLIGHKQENVTIDLSKASSDFRDSLLGIKAGESRNVTLLKPPLSPDEEKKYDYFQVSVKAVKKKELPEIDDDFACQVSNDVNDLNELKEAVHRELNRQIETMSYHRMANLLAHQLVDNTRLDIPEKMLNEYLDRMVEDARKSAESSEDKTFDEQLIRDHFRAKAIWNLRWYLTRKKLAEREGLKVEEDDLQREYEHMAAVSEKKPKQIQALYKEGKRRGQLEDDILDRKILQLLTSKANVIDRTISLEEFFAKDATGHEH